MSDRYLHSYRSNVGRTQDPDTRTAQGDFPEKVRTTETRPDVMETASSAGSIEEGVSMKHDLYKTPSDDMDPLEPTRLS